MTVLMLLRDIAAVTLQKRMCCMSPGWSQTPGGALRPLDLWREASASLEAPSLFFFMD